MTRKKNVSVRFLAQKTGLSTATISRVLNHDDRVSIETRNKILQAMNTYGYHRKSESQQPSNIIGIICPNITVDYFSALKEELFKYFDDKGYTCVFFRYSNEAQFTKAIQTVLKCDVDGIVFIDGKYQIAQPLLHSNLPTVWIDCDDIPNHLHNVCNVQSDHFTGGQLAAQEFLRKNCKKPLILNGPSHSYRTLERINGFCSEFTKRGIVIKESQIITLPYNTNPFYECRDKIRYMITKGYDFDSVFVISDWAALGTYVGITTTGKRVPEDIHLIGFDGISRACCSILNITSIQQDPKAISENACQLLIDSINRIEPVEKSIIIPTRVLPGQTV